MAKNTERSNRDRRGVMQLKIALNGAWGKMGVSLQNLIKQYPDGFVLQSSLDANSTPTERIIAYENSDVIIDFSTPEGTYNLLKSIERLKNRKLLIGTTGLGKEHYELMNNLADSHAILYAPNTSITANMVAELSAKVAIIMRDFDVEIIESHHRHKKDAPSGTAMMIGQKIAEARNINFDQNAVFARRNSPIKKKDDIGFSSIRAGGIYGDNQAIFAGDYEMLSIECRAISRDAFADGALKATKWLMMQGNGIYSMKDFLQI